MIFYFMVFLTIITIVSSKKEWKVFICKDLKRFNSVRNITTFCLLLFQLCDILVL